MEKKDEISARHPQYESVAKERKVFQDACKGTHEMREKGKTYLPKFPREKQESYDLRLKTATFFNITKKTADVMTGLVFKSEIDLGSDVPSNIQTLWENIDNAGTHGDVFARKVFEKSLEGYAAILVDAPEQKAQSLEDQQTLGLRPYWLLYDADSIINGDYRINKISKKKELEFIVFCEKTMERVGTKFLFEEVVRYRHFYLSDEETGTLVKWELKKEQKDKDGKITLIDDGEGVLEGRKELPIYIVGELWAKPPMLDIAYKNIEHFQTYSEYKTHIHKSCVPMLKFINYDTDGAEKIVGSDYAWMLGENGDAGWIELEGKSIETTRQSLIDMREEMALMGLSLLADQTAKVDVTATEALLNNIGETAELRVLARELQDAIEGCIGFTAEYLGMDKTNIGSIKLGTAWSNENQIVDTSGGNIPNGQKPNESVMVN